MKVLSMALVALLCLHSTAFAQSKKQNILPLESGELIPEITFTNFYNAGNLPAKISAYKGKLVILDFWSTWCTTCVSLFPKMEKLQQTFKDKLQVILVDCDKNDDIKKVKPFFERYEKNNAIKLTLPYTLVQETVKKYFPYRSVPQYVWISPEGKLLGITAQFEVTEDNIQRAIDGDHTLTLRTKHDQLDFDAQQPLFVNGNGGDGTNFEYRSVFTKYTEGLGNNSGIKWTEDKKITRYFTFNTSLRSLLSMAYDNKLNYPQSRIIIDAKDSLLLKPGAAEDSLWVQNAICYDIITPPCTLAEMRSYIAQDIYRVFHLSVKSEERNLPCMVIFSNADSLNLGGLLSALNIHPYFKSTPVVLGQQAGGNQEIQLPEDFGKMTWEQIKQFLLRSGITYSFKNQVIPVALITDKTILTN